MAFFHFSHTSVAIFTDSQADRTSPSSQTHKRTGLCHLHGLTSGQDFAISTDSQADRTLPSSQTPKREAKHILGLKREERANPKPKDAAASSCFYQLLSSHATIAPFLKGDSDRCLFEAENHVTKLIYRHTRDCTCMSTLLLFTHPSVPAGASPALPPTPSPPTESRHGRGPTHAPARRQSRRHRP